MKTKSVLLIALTLFSILATMFIFNSCKKTTLATINTLAISEIGGATAVCGGEITSDGNGDITERGVCWSSMGVPTTSDSKSSDGTGSGIFNSNLIGLTPGTAYTVRAYAINEAGVAYGNAMVFVTKYTPTAITYPVTDVSRNAAIGGGLASTQDESPILSRGVCWSTEHLPTIADSKTTDGSGSGEFTSNINGLIPGTIYYVRAYATNTYGAGYGMEVSFTTEAGIVPVLTTANITQLSTTSATSGGSITSNGGTPVLSRGVVWGTTSSITLENCLGSTSNGSGGGSFTSNMTGLAAGSSYYVKAYATNSTGTAYGDLVDFYTLPTVSLDAITAVSHNSASATITVSGTDLNAISRASVCYSTSANPTINNSHTQICNSYGTHIGNFGDLTANTTYYIRAYTEGNSGGTYYGNEMQFTTTDLPNCGTITDASGNLYQTVIINEKCWMKENLKTTKFKDGTDIANVTGDWAWSQLTTAAYCWYNNDYTNYGSVYGALYNRNAVNTDNLCPTGWHVSTDSDWHEIKSTTYYSTSRIRETGTVHWASPNSAATNSTGFTALPGGYRNAWGAFYASPSRMTYWWLDDLLSTVGASMDSESYLGGTIEAKSGLYVRCVKD